ncbi:MAG: helix-turn-helix domain-containing protein [Lachnospiraceae bacterium]|nr:helix-turn-helix domain-containing protein [Lachnospiraceae bacterium]MBD5505494.1 helix-turn-helix domain-containing protein [Lachnospiraceae bacterium]
MDESFMTTKEFCDRLQISSSTVYRMIKSGMIPAIKFGRYWKIPRSVFASHNAFSGNYQKIMREIHRIR